MNELFCYRAAEAVESAVRARLDEVRAFDEAHMLPWHDAHPEAPVMYVRASHGVGPDRAFVGFADTHPSRKPPAGLSRNRERRELIPARGTAGDPYREILELLNTRPRVAPVLDAVGIDVVLLDVSRGRQWRVAVLLSQVPGQTGMWLRYEGMRPSANEHMTEIATSQWFAEFERITAAEEAARGAGVAG